MTNKPEVMRYTPAYGVDSVMRGHLFMEECERGEWVSLDAYETLQAECEKLRKDAERYRWIKECEPEEIDIVIENPGDDLDSIIDAAMETTK